MIMMEKAEFEDIGAALGEKIDAEAIVAEMGTNPPGGLLVGLVRKMAKALKKKYAQY